MTVPTLNSVAEFSTNGVTTNFPFFFKFLANEDLVVTYVNPTGDSTVLAYGTQYTVNGAGDEDGGSVVTTVALAGPGQLVVSRVMDPYQQTSLRNQGKFLAETHEDVFDKLTMLIQQSLAWTGRALLRPFGKSFFDAENRLISNVADPVTLQDAATNGWVQRYIGGLIAIAQGPLNLAQNILYVSPGNITRTLKSKVEDVSATPKDYGAVGDGVTNDTSAFTLLEAAVTGKTIDLGGKTFVVSSIPKKNGYVNGFFKVAGFTRAASWKSSFAAQPATFHKFGGQLAKLKVSLSNPLEQITSIAFPGDSITWGVGTGESATSSPNTSLLTSARDNADANSWVNIFKRYIGERYAFGATQINSNWPAAPSGQAIAQFSFDRYMFPRRGDFTLTETAAGSISTTEQYSTAIDGTHAVMIMGNGNAGVESSHSIKFVYTGYSFTLGFTCQEATASYYELLVNGVSQGVFSTHAGVDGFVNNTRNNYRTHTFPKVTNGNIEIKTRRNGETGLREVYLQSIKVTKVINMINQGIIGVATRWYINFNMGAFTDQYGYTCDYAICQLGTNDRVFQATAPGGMNQFVYDLNAFVAAAPAATNKILMIANPATNEDPSVYSFNMQDARGVIMRVGKANNLDVVDNYATLASLDNTVVTSDGLHPSILGHSMIARNLINALEAA
ncbi:phage tail fiber protein [Pseudomonas fluorescens]|uniref:phage tail fiber domain-containing protein n=1 Tax=Pseudomonas fluorescens TaxID=294 RepID=UPI0009BB1FAF|nr:phage tail fiber protein [Pseudomonas fluorescens]